MKRDATDKRVLNYCEEVLLFDSDVSLLNARNWLNDQIISFALEYIYRETLRPLQQAEVCIVSPNVSELFKFGDAAVIEQVCSDLGFGDKALLLLPVNDNDNPKQTGGSHWSLLVFRRKTNRFEHLDSVSSVNFETAEVIATACAPFLKTTSKPDLRSVTVPRQTNGCDCGVYLIEFAKIIVQAFGEEHDVEFNKITPKFIDEQRKVWKELILRLSAEEKNADSGV